MVTFGPDGMTGHPDHQTMSAWVTEAWRRAGAPGALWYATTTPEFQAEWEELHTELDIWFEGMVPPVTQAADLALELRSTMSCSTSSTRCCGRTRRRPAVLEEMLGTEVFRAWWATEYFVAARPGGY